MRNWADNVLEGIPNHGAAASLFAEFLAAHDFAPSTRRAMTFDFRKFAAWFSESNREPLDLARATVRDLTDFRETMWRQRGQAPASVNRALVTLRRFLGWLVGRGELPSNPADAVKELRRVPLTPKGLDRAAVRKLLREAELRGDVRASALFHVMLFTGARVSDIINLGLGDVALTERTGTVTFRGKGNKQRTVPLPLNARRALEVYLASRPPVEAPNLFIGERGPLTDKGVRAICSKYSALTGVKLHPHALRHSFAHRYLEDNGNDLVGLAQLLGHENIQTTARYSQRTQAQLTDAVERVSY